MPDPQFAITESRDGGVVLRRARPGELEELRRLGQGNRIVPIDGPELEQAETQAYVHRTQGGHDFISALEGAGNTATLGIGRDILRQISPGAAELAERRDGENMGANLSGSLLGALLF